MHGIEKLIGAVKDLVEAQREANVTNRAVLKSIEIRDEENSVHQLASILVSMRFIRNEYCILVETLEKDVDNENIQKLIDDLVALFGNLTQRLGLESRQGFAMRSARELIEVFQKKKTAEAGPS